MAAQRHPLYHRWRQMRRRCTNPADPDFHRYGGRGIRVCRSWDNFWQFVIDMCPTWPGPGYDLHRVDNDGHYSPKNCVWISRGDHAAISNRSRRGESGK